MAVTINCIADLCLIPIGTPTASVSEYVTEVVKLVRDSGLKYCLHSAGTTIEGPWNEVTDLIGRAHQHIHSLGVFRIQSDIRIGTRTDKVQSFEDKVEAVNRRLNQEKK